MEDPMKGAVFTGNRRVELQDFPDPKPGPDEVVVEIKASGMCGSDLHIYRSPGGGPAMAAALGLGGKGTAVIGGHEPCGVVIERGKAVPERLGRTGTRVMVHHYWGCGICPSCRQGWSQLCKDAPMVVYGVTGHGAHAPCMQVPAMTVLPLPDALSFEEGAAISCGTGTAYGALRRMHVEGGATVAIFGQGPVGLSGTLLAHAMGARVLAVDIGSERLALADSLGAAAAVNAGTFDPVAKIKELTGGRGADFALECSGVPEVRVQAVRAVKTWGTVCYVGEGKTVTLDVSQDILRKQLTLLGSWTFSSVGQADCARFIAERAMPLPKLVTHRIPRNEAAEAYTLFDKQTMGKGMVVPS